MEKTAAIISRLIAWCLIAQLLISINAWLPFHRSFPTVPLLGQWSVRWGAFLNTGFFLSMLGSCAFLAIRPFSKKAMLLLLLCFCLDVLEDATRLQPWFWLFALMYSAFLFFDVMKDAGKVLLGVALVLSSVYLWSGLQKMNIHFAVEMFPWLCEFTGARSFAEQHHWLAYSVGGLEALGGILLWFPGTKKQACFLIFGVHLFILLSLGPTGHNWNKVVWPWNICFALLTYILFFRESGIKRKELKMGLYHFALSVVIFILPVLNFFGRWDHFLSGSYYSSLVSSGVLTFSLPDADKLPASSKAFQFYSREENMGVLMLDAWALDELQVPLYPEDRVHIALRKEFKVMLSHPGQAELRIFEKLRFDARTTVFRIPLSR
ncbi:MAG TPA: hypothetical protein VI112_00340 [Bacteroidia bacterium]|jgi:hypothetical protein